MSLQKILLELLSGMVTSSEIFLLTLLLALPLGLLISFGRMAKCRILRFLTQFYISVMRGTPLMLQLLVVYYGPYFIFGIRITNDYRFIAVIIGFVLNYAAYFAEIYRGGINSIDKGQYEAAHALGLSRRQTMLDIIMPQTMKAILPPVVNEAITLVKDTALASTLPIVELMKATNSAVNGTTSMIPFFCAAAIYLIMTFVLTVLAGRLEKYFKRYDAKEEW